MDKLAKILFFGVFMGGSLLCRHPSAFAIVGKAVGLSEFEEQDLIDFQTKVLEENRSAELSRYDDIRKVLMQKEGEIDNLEGEVRDVLKRDIESLKAQLLSLPKRDRVKYELKGNYTYDSNVNRSVPRSEKGDSVFEVEKFILLDLSGKKTDFRFDLGWKREWNHKFPNSDSYQYEERLRFRRKYFKKILASSNSRIAKHNSKTIEIDEDKVRWDFNNQLAINFPFSRKLSLNADVSGSKRLFRQEAFDQDSSRQVVLAGSAFWNVTPKSRFQTSYRFGASRIRLKTGDANSHNLALGYFGKLTKKSSLSTDIAFNYQTPRSLDTSKVRTMTVGTGHIWQITPKTQLATQVTRSMQNTTSNLASGEVDGENTVTKTDTRVTTDNVSFSINTRLIRKLTTVLTVAMTHSRTKTTKSIEQLIDDDTQSRVFTFPASVSLTYAIRRWITLNLGYSFGFRTGNEKNETSRTHTWSSRVRMLF